MGPSAHEPLDLAVLRALRDWRGDGQRALLVTVVSTWGSSPRPPGSMLALRADGLAVGSVSGGCIEDDIALRFVGGADACMPAGAPQRLRYGVDAEQAQRFGLPCGGSVELLVEADPDAPTLAALLRELDAGHLVRRTVRLADGLATHRRVDAPAPLALDERELSLPLGPGWRLLLVGANAIAQLLAPMARATGFAVSVCDPREDARRAWTSGDATLVDGMPDDAVRAFAPDRCSAVIGLTHDPKLDDLALLEALPGPAFYVGALGSRRSSATRRARLAEHFGLSAAQLERLRGPIGLPIGSRTPAEIAVSVMAELLAVRSGAAR